jgi:hypothetical protein
VPAVLEPTRRRRDSPSSPGPDTSLLVVCGTNIGRRAGPPHCRECSNRLRPLCGRVRCDKNLLVAKSPEGRQNLPICRQRYIIYIIERDKFTPSHAVSDDNDEAPVSHVQQALRNRGCWYKTCHQPQASGVMKPRTDESCCILAVVCIGAGEAAGGSAESSTRDDCSDVSTEPPEKPAPVRRRSTRPAVRAVLHIERATANDATSRRHSLESDLAAFRQACADSNLGAAQSSLKRCLETLHELNEDPGCSQRGWTADERDVWQAHLGARNGAHHKSAHIMAFRLRPGGASPIARWSLPPETVRSAHQRAEYESWLHGREVLPALEMIIALVERSVAS